MVSVSGNESRLRALVGVKMDRRRILPIFHALVFKIVTMSKLNETNSCGFSAENWRGTRYMALFMLIQELRL